MLYTLTFSKKVNDIRQTYTIDGTEAKVTVEANGRIAAMEHPDTLKFCKDHECTVRKVFP